MANFNHNYRYRICFGKAKSYSGTVPRNHFYLNCILPLAQIAIPLAVAFAKVARADYPAYWSSLFQDLINLVNANDTLTTRRVFLTLHHILKELASMRLPSSQRNFAQVGYLLGQEFLYVMTIQPFIVSWLLNFNLPMLSGSSKVKLLLDNAYRGAGEL